MSRVCLSKTEILKHPPSCYCVQYPQFPYHMAALPRSSPGNGHLISHLTQSPYFGTKENLWESRCDAQVVPPTNVTSVFPTFLPLSSFSFLFSPASAPQFSLSTNWCLALCHCFLSTPLASSLLQQIKAQALVLRHPCNSTLLHIILTLCPRAHYLTSLILSFPISKTGTTTPSWSAVRINTVKFFQNVPAPDLVTY